MDNFDIDDVIVTLRGKGEILPRHLYSLWKHFPERDLNPKDSVQAHIEFQELVKSDLIKLSPHSKYALVDFGVQFDAKEYNKATGSYITKKYPINSIDDWEKIDEFDPQTGELGKQLELVKQVSTKYQNIPTMMTIFLPTMIGRKLVKQDKLIQHLHENKLLVTDRLQVITNVMTEFSKICIELGSKGLFLATQETDIDDGWDIETWKSCAYPFDKQVIEKLRSRSEFQVLHLHGSNIFFKDVLKKFKPTSINFHAFPDFQRFFAKKGMREIFNGGLLGGIDDKILEGLKTEVNSETKEKNEFFESFEPVLGRILLAPNCVLPQSLTNQDLGAIITNIRG